MSNFDIQAKGNDPTEIRKIFQQIKTKINDSFVPYVGASKNVDIGLFSLYALMGYFDSIKFDTTPTTDAIQEGELRWNATDGTLDLGMSSGNITMQIGQEMFQKVRNVSGATILNGKAVYVNGRTGNRPNIYLARSDAESTSCVIGITTQDILSPADGYVTTFGYVRGIKTDYTGSGDWGTTWVAGDKLYISKTVAGQLTNIEPAAPHHSDVVATVEIVHQNLGSILVNFDRHKTLEELTDVNGTALSIDGQFPVWNNTSKYFDFNFKITDYLKRDQTTPDTTTGLFTFPQIQISDLSATRFAYSQASGRLATTASADDITVPVQSGKTLLLENVVWDDLQINVSTIRTPAASAPTWTSYKGSEVLTFSKSATNVIYFNAQLPHRYKQGTDIEFHIHVAFPDNSAGNSIWYFTYSWANVNSEFPAESNSGNITFASPTTTDRHALKSLIATIDGHTVSKNISSIILCSLSRLGGDGSDNYDNVIYLVGADFHYQIDTIGSRTETAK